MERNRWALQTAPLQSCEASLPKYQRNVEGCRLRRPLDLPRNAKRTVDGRRSLMALAHEVPTCVGASRESIRPGQAASQAACSGRLGKPPTTAKLIA